MALLLIMGRNNTHADLEKDLRGCYKRGDVVEVFDDVKHDGDLVRNPIMPPFILVRVTDVTKAQLDRLISPQVEDFFDLDGAIRSRLVRRRRHLLEVDAATLPNSIRNQIRDNRYVSVTWAQVRNFLRNKETGATEGTTP